MNSIRQINCPGKAQSDCT